MLLILEGTDKSGKSMIARRLHEQYSNVVMIKKMYPEELYPIDFGAASEHDWVTLLDRVILANPHMIFVADRSFITQVIYQQYFAPQTITQNHLTVENNVLSVIKKLPHLFIITESERYELDQMVTSKEHVDALRSAYVSYHNNLCDSGFNSKVICTSDKPFTITYSEILSMISEMSKESGIYLIPKQ